MNIVILGPGAIGALWATHFHHAGHKVSVWSTSKASELVITLDNRPSIPFLNCDLLSVRQADLILVTVKAWQVEKALAPLQDDINADTIIMLMHNGMGSAEATAKRFAANPLILATTTHGAYKPEPLRVLHTGQGQTHIGGYNSTGKQCQFLADVMDHALPRVLWNNTIEQALWTKLAINCAINPLTAIEKITNGELSHPRYQVQLAALLDEVCQVLNAEGIPCQRAELTQTVNEVIQATASNHSSMQQDIAHQRRSEIDFISGYLIERAAVHGINTPVNQHLYQQIKQIEQSWKQQ